MFSIRGRILTSYLIFGGLLLTLSLLAYSFIQETSSVRALQNRIIYLSSRAVLLMDEDVTIRTEKSLMSEFYVDNNYLPIKKRNEIYREVIEGLTKLGKNEMSWGLLGDQQSLLDLKAEVISYNNSHNELIKLLKKRGFKDEGLEGEMRGYAHQLENYPRQINMVDVLSLRRHEKDYFLRADTIYVVNFNKLATTLKEKYTHQSTIRDLVSSYQQTFNEVVLIENQIGNIDRGILAEISYKKAKVKEHFDALSTVVNTSANNRVTVIVNRLIYLILFGLLFTGLLGYFSANLVSNSIKRLAKSMKNAINNGFYDDIKKPHKWTTKETKSLFNSYSELLKTISIQLEELESKNDELSVKNDELSEVIDRLKESEDNLKTSNDLKDKFFSIIAHDLKGPMASLTMLLEYIHSQIDELTKEQTVLFTTKMMETSQSISILLDNLLNWARNQNNNLIPYKEEVLVNPVIDGIGQLNRQRIAEKSITFHNKVDPEAMLLADRNMMDLVFRNLIDNSIKFTPVGGEVTVYSNKSDETICICFQDTGIGIMEKDMETLFTSLVKKQSEGTAGEKGTGLGLVLTFDFVHKNGGQLEVESELGRGSIFKVIMPTS